MLDFLAAELIDSGWSLKRLHRLIITSAAYRRSSSNRDADAPTLAFDPQNKYLWRMHPRRMESETVRDSLLALAGQIDLQLGGPSLPVTTDSHRRSLFYRHSRDDEHPFLILFDHADHLQCYRREESIVPQQALALANARLVARCTSQIARHWVAQTESPREFAELAFSRLLGRRPSPDELDACVRFLGLPAGDRTDAPRPMADRRIAAGDSILSRNAMLLVHALVNHNDFITIR